MKGTRYGDPFRHGIADLYAGTGAENWKNIFYDITNWQNSEEYKKLKDLNGRVRQKGNRVSEDLVQSAIKYLKENGEVPCEELSYYTGRPGDKVKNALTYRCNIYESDDGDYVGLLDDDGEPIPTKEDRPYIGRKAAYEFTYNGKCIRFYTLASFARYVGSSIFLIRDYIKRGKSTNKILQKGKVKILQPTEKGKFNG